MTKYEIPLLTKDDIEVRAQQVKQAKNGVGAALLLYKDARVDMRILDEVFGVTGWQRKHELINGNLFCTIDIWDAEKQVWVSKQDVGVESNTEKEKGQASDAFKRAGFNVGIGRELYTAPFIWVTLDEGEYYTSGQTVRMGAGVSFNVDEIAYNDRKEIIRLVIKDNKGRVRYELGKYTAKATAKAAEPAKEPPKEKKLTPKQTLYARALNIFGDKTKAGDACKWAIENTLGGAELTEENISAVMEKLNELEERNYNEQT
jgi:hypothetical protein